jgi:hypothetical protein
MCKAFSCIIDSQGTVTWKLGIDGHTVLAELGGYTDRTLGEFAKIEITPRNGDYLNPDSWVYSVDESPVPNWCGAKEKELCLAAHKKWLKALDKFIIRHPIVHPFKLAPPATIQPKHIRLLKKMGLGLGLGWGLYRQLLQHPRLEIRQAPQRQVSVSTARNIVERRTRAFIRWHYLETAWGTGSCHSVLDHSGGIEEISLTRK